MNRSAASKAPHLRAVPTADIPITFRTIHGYQRAVRICGDGPPLLLIHGLGDNSETWLDVIPYLARKFTVIAPDLLGHGQSEKPRADYSAGGYANGMRDLLTVLGYDRVTIVGHSMGGGIAMQIAYQFPELVERVVLVCAGGVSKEVHPLLRLASAPALSNTLALLKLPLARSLFEKAVLALKLAHDVLAIEGPSILHDAADVVRVVEDQAQYSGERAFVRILRAGVDWRGQVITLLDRSHLFEHLPVQIIWGQRDAVIPVSHAHLAHAALPASRLTIFDKAAHFPFRDDPVRFVHTIENFVAETAAATFDPVRWRAAMADGFSANADLGGVDHQTVLDAMEVAERNAT